MSRKWIDEFIATPGKKVDLSKRDPGSTLHYHHKKEALEHTVSNAERLADLQYRLYAERKRGLLICLQALDAGGKDGTIRHVMTGVNPQGCNVVGFKQPSEEEQDHDYLWRIHSAVPGYGMIGIFNRSHYEDVLVVRVHNLVPESVWSRRYEQINQFEAYLHANQVHIVKFFLHMSKEEQKRRFQARLETPEKHWKVSPPDFKERQFWDQYMAAFEDALTRCSTHHAPWFIIPADHKWFRNLAVSQILVETLEAMNPQFPAPVCDVSKIKIDD